jgi:hypothetical protein
MKRCCENYLGKYHEEKEALNFINLEFICDSCLHDEFIECDRCKGRFHQREMQQTYYVYLNGYYCDGCAPKRALEIKDCYESDSLAIAEIDYQKLPF